MGKYDGSGFLRLTFLLLACVLSACSGAVQTAAPTTPAPPATATLAPLQPTLTPLPATALPAATLTPVPSPTQIPIYLPGQVVKLKDLALVVLDVEYVSNQLQVMFALKNTGASAQTISAFSFLAVMADGTKLSTDFCKNGPFSSPDGLLEPGEIVRGSICWKTASEQSGIKVNYSHAYDGPAAATWDVSGPGQVNLPAEFGANDIKIPVHTQGEVVTQNEIAVSFDGYTAESIAQLKRQSIVATFTVVNKGSSSLKLPSFGSSFILRTADGYTFTQPISGHLCQNASTDVEIKSGQKLTMTLCYTSSGPTLAPGTTARFISPDQSWIVLWLLK